MSRPRTLGEALPRIHRVGRYFSADLLRERKLLALGLTALLAQIAFRLVEPWPLKFVVDSVLGGRDWPRPLHVVATWTPGLSLVALACALLLVVAARAACGYAAQVSFALAGQRVLTRIRERLYRHVLRLPLAFRPQTQLGDVVTRIVGDVGILKEATVTALVPLAANALLLVGMTVVMGWMDWRLAAAAALPLPLFIALTTRQTRRIQGVAREQREREAALASAAAESVGALQAVQALTLELHFERSFEAANHADLRKGAKGKRLAAALERGVDVLIGISTAIVLALGAQRVLGGALSVGELLVFLAYQRRAVRPLRDFAKYSARLAKATAAGERVVELFESPLEVSDRPGAREAPALSGGIRFRDVYFSYPGRPDVLRGFDLSIEAGERVAVVGPSGSGKSTLLRLLLRLCDPTDGAIEVDGMDLRSLRIKSLRRQISIILEDAPVFRGTLRENVLWGNGDASADRLAEAFRTAHLEEFVSALPEGRETLLGERGVALSRGQRQRVSIARAALRDAPILLLDEALTGLDSDAKCDLRRSLEALARGRTVLWISHEAEDRVGFDRVIHIEDGRAVDAAWGLAPAPLRVGGSRA